MRLVFLLFFVTAGFAFSVEMKQLDLEGSRIALVMPEKWTLEERGAEVAIYAPEQAEGKPARRIHLVRIKDNVKSLQEAIDAEIDRVTAKSPKWGASGDRRAYKGSVPVKTKFGMEGLRADFWSEGTAGRSYAIVKYYFFDEKGRPFKVCSHIVGDQARFEAFENVILGGLSLPPK